MADDYSTELIKIMATASAVEPRRASEGSTFWVQLTGSNSRGSASMPTVGSLRVLGWRLWRGSVAHHQFA